MTTQQLTEKFYQNHKDFATYISSLSDKEFNYAPNGKWTAGQQLAHVYLCLLPISQALHSKDFIFQKFGQIDRPTLSYDHVIENYRKGLEAGGKAPGQFLPQDVGLQEREELLDKLETILSTINQQLSNYSEQELDTLVLPHPFLGKLTIREFFFLMTYHATHHLQQTQQNSKL